MTEIPKFGDMFVGTPTNNKADLHVGFVISTTEMQNNEIMISVNFENLRTGVNRGNGMINLEAYNKNISDGTFKKVTQEEVEVMRLLFTDLSVVR